jgi:hypothetical protein
MNSICKSETGIFISQPDAFFEIMFIAADHDRLMNPGSQHAGDHFIAVAVKLILAKVTMRINVNHDHSSQMISPE